MYNRDMLATRSISIALIAFIAMAVLLVPIAFVSAQAGTGGEVSEGLVPCDGSQEKPCDFCALAALLQNLLNFGVYASMLAGGGMFAYAGFLYLTNMGDRNKVSNAHTIFRQVLVGLLIILSAWLLIDIIMKSLVRDDGGFGPWNRVCSQEIRPL